MSTERPKPPPVDPDALWRDFQYAFVAALFAAQPPELWEMWSDHARRTAFYKNRVVPLITQHLGLIQYNGEWLNADHALGRWDGGNGCLAS